MVVLMIPANSMPLKSRNQGIAMIAALGLMAIASAVMLLLFMRTMDELRHGRDDAGIVQTLLAAQGGANLGVALLRNDVEAELDEIASVLSDSVGAWSFGSSDAMGQSPTAQSVATDLAQVATSLQSRIDSMLCNTLDVGSNVEVTLRIYVTPNSCGIGLPDGVRIGDGRFVSGYRRELGGNQRYALPFVMVSDGVQGEFRRRVVTQGEYQFDVGRRSFARYALFTNRHVSDQGGDRIWFTSDTLFDGPVHTNGNFNYFGRAWFGGAVSTAGVTQGNGQGAFGFTNGNGRFFNAGDLDSGGNSPNLDTPGFTNRPEFDRGVDWRSEYIALPENAHDQHTLAGDNGILFTQHMDSLELFAANSSGNPVAAGDTAVYQYVRAVVRNSSNGPSYTITYRISPEGRLERHISGNNWDVETETFNGVIYSERYIDRLRGPGRTNDGNPATARPALAAFSQLTIVPQVGARITSDLIYEEQPCTGSLHRDGNEVVRAQCDNLNAANVLGIFSPTGNIDIGNHSSDSTRRAPHNVRIQGSLLTSSGVVRVERFNQGNPRGAVSLLGGIIEQEYGAFGTFSAANASMSSGYAREFTFDPRMGRGLTPPYFPTVGVDGVTDTITFTFGHREQVF